MSEITSAQFLLVVYFRGFVALLDGTAVDMTVKPTNEWGEMNLSANKGEIMLEVELRQVTRVRQFDEKA